MDYIIILLITLLSIFIIRIIPTIFLNSHKESGEIYQQVFLSFAILGLFIVIWGMFIYRYMRIKQITDSRVLYIIFTFFGISAIVWCHSHWDFKWTAKPRFEEDKYVLAIKKTLVFLIVLIFVFYHGWKQIDAMINEKDIDNNLTVYNVTLISGIIALDRVLNQVALIYSVREEKKRRINVKREIK